MRSSKHSTARVFSPPRTYLGSRQGETLPTGFGERELPGESTRAALDQLPSSPSRAEPLILTVPRAAGMAISVQLYHWEH